MIKFEDMSDESISKIMAGIAASIVGAAQECDLEVPQFALFLFNDPTKDYCVSNMDKDEMLKSVASIVKRSKEGAIITTRVKADIPDFDRGND